MKTYTYKAQFEDIKITLPSCDIITPIEFKELLSQCEELLLDSSSFSQCEVIECIEDISSIITFDSDAKSLFSDYQCDFSDFSDDYIEDYRYMSEEEY